MKTYKFLNINGAVIDSDELEKHLEKIASNHTIKPKSDKQTYPIPRMLENYDAIKEVYVLLNQHLKLGIAIHPAGEWLLDNFYVIEETMKAIKKELSIKKYKNFVGLQNGQYAGFARIYVLASEIIAYTDNKVEREDLERYLKAYQVNKTLSMDEIWNIGLFLQIAIIEKIRQICEIIYIAQMQKYKVENIVERLVEKKKKSTLIFKINFRIKSKKNAPKYPFIEYMAYILKRYGKKAHGYLSVLEETIERTGQTLSDIIKKEHYSIAVQKVSMGNSITSIKEIQRINFLEIFEKINGVEEILKSDPAGVYSQMDYKTKECYRNKIKEISKKTKISEMYIAKKILEIAKDKEEGTKTSHIGYYLIDNGIQELYTKLQYKNKSINSVTKVKIYILTIIVLSIVLSIGQALWINGYIKNNVLLILNVILLFIPTSELVIQIIQYILGKFVKPKIIPKLDFYNGIDEKNSCIVVIPTIISSKQKAKELIKKLEIFYLANKSKNIYFALLGDCTQSDKRTEEFDQDVIKTGLKEVEKLNNKYSNQEFPIFHFLYRNRMWNEKENCYIGWERKRGLLTQFNEYLLGNEPNRFKSNTLEEAKSRSINKQMPNIKYVITLDADTELPLNSGFELVGAMAHILNKPILNENKNIVIEGHALIQPRIGVNLNISYKNVFTKIFAGAGGTDCYTNAVSDTYQDNFEEGIFTGKGIYDLNVFSEVLKNEIPENTVLSHDLLEGSYLRCGLATDILLMDGYPSKYLSFTNRLSRWIRGDWQIIRWIKNGPLNLLSKYKIFDNLRRSIFEVFCIISIIYFIILEATYNFNATWQIAILLGIVASPFLIEIISQIVFKKEGELKQKTFIPKIDGIPGALARAIITIGCLPHKAFVSEIAKWKTIYRMEISHKHLLEWMTSEEAEKLSKTDILTYYKSMIINIVLGIAVIIYGFTKLNILYIVLAIIWLVTPGIMYYISKESAKQRREERLTDEENKYIQDIAKKTWKYFEEYLTEENNYLIPDNFQEDRVPEIIDRTSSTNIGLSLLAVISSLDMKITQKDEILKLLESIINTIYELPKWNGHLYNWYNIKTKKPLNPRYVSTVDSGNFVGYLYVVKTFLNKNADLEESTKKILLEKVDKMIKDTDFFVLYNKELRLFSIGFNVEENKLTDSYYDLLASEARQASLVAIAKGDVPAKHWNNLSRTMTSLNGYKGLISWSGTAFEYLMPNINVPKFKGSLLDESCRFAIESQIEYSKRLGIPWGISEAAFNAKDLHSNYQYKAFGIPWLGLKRGLADEMVVSSYGSVLGICEKPKEVFKNLKMLESQGMYNKYGFYESIDYTPERGFGGKIGIPVKTYMAHHQALILLSINNFLNEGILQKRFAQNPEIEAVSILLQERMPNKFIITKENKEKVEKLKYKDYENYSKVELNKVDERLIRGNVISNANYTVALNQKGIGFSRFKNYYINRYKKTDDYPQGIFFYIKNIKSGKIWGTNYNTIYAKPDKYVVNFMPDQDEIQRIDANIKTKMQVTVASNEALEIRRLELENLGNEDEIIEVTSFFEPILSSKEKDYAHPAFNNLFLGFEYDKQKETLVVKRRKRSKGEEEIYLATKLSADAETIGDIEYEIDKEKFIGRGNIVIPKMVKESIPLSKKIGLVTEPIVAIKRTIKINPKEKIYVDLIISVDNDKETAIKNLEKHSGTFNIKRTFELSKARVEAENRYLGVKAKEIELYQKMLSYIIFDNPIKRVNLEKSDKQKYKQSDLWKYGISGDLPIILVKIKDVNDIYVIKQILKAYEFFRSKNEDIELVILNEENYSYQNYVKEEIENSILSSQIAYMKNTKGGIFVLSKDETNEKDISLLKFISSIIIDSHMGSIETGIKDLEEEYLEKFKNIWEDKRVHEFTEESEEDSDVLEDIENLKYYNEYGAYSEDGKEYLIKTNKENRLPTVWSHIMANNKFGTIVTENMGGYTWFRNSRLNRITAWNNSPTLDVPSEVIYLKNIETGKTWSIGANPMPDNKNYNIIYGLGYAKYIHNSSGIEQKLKVFVPKEDSVKINILTLKNTTPNKKKIKLVYYTKQVLAEDEIKSNGYINVKYEANSNMISCSNLYSNEFENTISFISSSEKIKSYTGDKKFFFGEGGLSSPDCLKKVSLNNSSGLGTNTCAAIELELELESFTEKEICLCLGAAEKLIDAKDLAYKYSKISNCNSEYEAIKNYWSNLLEKIKVETPIESINIMLNGWAMYQTISSRLLARSRFLPIRRSIWI